ncbi:Rrf2 family transcriptional regulator [Clostridia bacterium]|nr:Rrf2 family transcriptional regulator [Clostridia bacterium]
MRISVKGRYALAAVIEIAQNSKNGENIAVINIAGALGISKIYLEQVFTQLKKAGVLVSVKGSKGGYQLSRPPGRITAWDVLSALETSFVEPVENTVEGNAPEIEATMNHLVFGPLDAALRECLGGVTVRELLDDSEKQRAEQSFMLNM